MKIHTIGGYDEVGKNMTAVEVGEDVIIFDAGLFLPAIVGVEEREKIPTEKGMRTIGALPDDIYLDKHNLRSKVRAILISHAHLDHVGGVPYIAPRYKAPVLGSDYTIAVLKVLMQDSNQKIPNRLISIKPDKSFTIKGKSGTYKIEFLNMTHSTIESSIIALHTPEGIVIYGNDYKLDNSPVFGEKPNYKRLKELSKIGIKALIVDCLYAPDDRKTPSEKIAKTLLEDVFSRLDSKSGIVITTFSSHIARLKTIVEFGKRMNREVIFLGRSLGKYVLAAESINKAPFRKDIKLVAFRRKMEKLMNQVNKDKSKYLIVCTGHQGEPGSILDRMSRNDFPLKLNSEFNIIFSSKTIPTPINELSRRDLEVRLKKKNVKIYDNVHVSGHGGKEDLKDLINLTKPENIIPSHGELKKREAGAKTAEEMGYKRNKSVHLLDNGEALEF